MGRDKWFLSSLVVVCALVLMASLSYAPTRAQDAEFEEEVLDLKIASSEALYKGQYLSAQYYAQQLAELDAESDHALWVEARALREGRNPNDAIELLESADVLNTQDQRLLVEYAYCLLAVGRYEEAVDLSLTILQSDANDTRGFYVAGEALYQLGRHKSAYENFKKGAAQGGNLATRKPEQDQSYAVAEQFYASGRCAYRLDDFVVTQARFDQGVNWHSKHTGCWLGLAQAFYETNKDESARGNYCQPVLEYNPNSAGAHYWSSLTYAFRWRADDARISLNRAIRANRWHVPSLALRAMGFIQTQQFSKGLEDAEAALAINPNSLEALAAKALWALVLGKAEEFGQLEAHVESFNQHAGEFYLKLGQGLHAMFLFDDAVYFYEKGIKLQPDLWQLHTGLGKTQLNLGENEAGKENLKIAFDNDLLRNNLFTRNLLELLNSYDDFTTLEDPQERFTLRLHHSEKGVMGDYYMRFLSQTFDELTQKYDGFEPRHVVVEAFNRHRDFEVRTVGIQGLPALGACFGRLVTLDSPLARDVGTYNWASTLRHEMDHVYQLQISKGQCPRWLAEGCSVYEERRFRPEWERHMEDELYTVYSSNGLPKVKEFNEWFHDGSRVLFAYYLASVMVEYIVEEYGDYRPIIAMIREFSRRRTPDQVFRETLKIDAAAFDRSFREYVGKKIGKIKLFPAIEVSEIEDLQEKAEDGDATLQELVRLARAQYQRGNATDARIWAGMAKKWGVDTKEVNYILGRLAGTDPRLLEKGTAAEVEQEYLTRALNQGLEDYDLYMRMASLAQQEQKLDAMIFYLNEARRAFPTNPQPLSILYQLYMSEGNVERAQDIAEQYIMLDENDLNLRGWLIERFKAVGDTLAIADLALQMIWVAPYLPIPHQVRAEALQDLEEYDEALFEWRMLRQVYVNTNYAGEDKVPGEVGAILGMARTYLDMGDSEMAMEMILDAQALAPDDSRVQNVLAEVRGDDYEEHFR